MLQHKSDMLVDSFILPKIPSLLYVQSNSDMNTSILTRYPGSCAGVSVVNVDVLGRSETISEKLKNM